MSLSRNTTLEHQVGIVTSEANELAEYWTGTLLEKLIIHDRDALNKVIKIRDYKATYPLLGKLKKTLAEARV